MPQSLLRYYATSLLDWLVGQREASIIVIAVIRMVIAVNGTKNSITIKGGNDICNYNILTMKMLVAIISNDHHYLHAITTTTTPSIMLITMMIVIIVLIIFVLIAVITAITTNGMIICVSIYRSDH